MFSLESPHRGDSIGYTQYTIFNIEKKITLNFPKSAATDFFQQTQERVGNSCSKRAISVRATEGLLYIYIYMSRNISKLTKKACVPREDSAQPWHLSLHGGTVGGGIHVI